eukprot:436350_1
MDSNVNNIKTKVRMVKIHSSTFFLMSLCMMRFILSFIVISIANSVEYFISKNGTDNPACGNQHNPCMTLYYVSTLIQLSKNNVHIINIIDGQSHTINIQNNNTIYNPCLPMPFDSSNDVTINFNKTNIHQFRDWYPTECDNSNHYDNQYMFDGGKSLTMNNLVISDHNILPFIHSAKIQCNDCLFMDIIVPKRTGLIYAENTMSIPSMIILQHTQFVNVASLKFDGNTIGIENSLSDRTSKIIIDNCKFSNVSTHQYGAIFYEFSGELNINNTEIHMTGGSIYYSHNQFENNINIYNVSIISTEVDHWFALIEFTPLDTTNIHQMHITYLYDASVGCQPEGDIINHVINQTCVLYRCTNAQRLIYNSGEMFLDSMSIDMEIKETKTMEIMNESDCTQFQYDQNNVFFILNEGEMTMKNINIKRTISRNLIQNKGSLHIFNLSFDPTINDIYMYDPYELHSTRIVYQSGDRS